MLARRNLRKIIGLAVAIGVAAAVGMSNGAHGAEAQQPPTGFLTGPNTGDPLQIVLAYLSDHHADFGLTAADITGVAVTDRYGSEHTGVTHIYLGQRLAGIEVFNGLINANVANDGSLVNIGSRFVRNLAGGVNTAVPTVTPSQAAVAAARSVELTPTEPITVVSDKGGPAREVVLSDGGISRQPIPAKLVYQPVDGNSARLAWNVEIAELSTLHWWSIRVDAVTGTVLSTADYVDEERDASGVPVNDGSSYRAFELPKESPSDGDRTVVGNPATGPPSPFGWHDTNGAAGPEFTVTRGNNVEASVDADADDLPDPGSEPSGGPGLDFDFALDLTQQPHTYKPAAVTNLFYYNNVIHDFLYGYGFNEAAGNFQVNNYGRGGTGNDDVKADAQDGSGTNNANFLTLPDGINPRMQMFVWQPALPNVVVVNPPSAIAGDYEASGAVFGGELTTTGVTGDVVLANDATNPDPNDGCETMTGLTGKIALMNRGNCNFTVKVKNAQTAGAVAAIVVNNADGPPVTMGATTPDPTITIPSVMVSKADGNTFKANLPFNATLKSKGLTVPHRDSDLDNGVIAHEYGHGLSNRLTGGPSNTACLENDEQMGEGWSDYLALVMTAVASDTATTSRGIGTYVVFQPADGIGIRPTAYTTNMSVNPSTYNTIKTAAIPHGVGYVWATMLWEVYWNLVTKHGFNPDLYGDWQSGGNNLAFQLVVDGMKLQPCSPGFVDGRDAILRADQLLTGGQNQCLIWRGFAKRGLGVSASQGVSPIGSFSTTDGTQAFDLPPQCGATIAVNPASLASSQPGNTQRTAPLTVKSEGTSDLTWSITEAASDCGSPSDLSWVSVAPSSGTTAAGASSNVTVTFNSSGLTPPAKRTGMLCVASNDATNAVVEVPVSLQVIYAFAGFFSPVSNPPKVNSTRAGSIVPVKFSLGGNQGLSVLAAGSPSSRSINCSTKVATGASEPTSGGPLKYDSAARRYQYDWRTTASWANTCRELIVTLADGTDHVAYFRFKS